MKTISSQRYIDDAIVAQKMADADFTVAVSPAFEIDGETYRVVLDGHHSFSASHAAGVGAIFVEYTASDHDAVALLDQGAIEDFLAVTHLGSDYYDVSTGRDVW